MLRRTSVVGLSLVALLLMTAESAFAHTISTGFVTVWENSAHCLKSEARIWEDVSLNMNIRASYATRDTTEISPGTIACNQVDTWTPGQGKTRGRYIINYRPGTSGNFTTCTSIAFTTGAGGVNFGQWPDGKLERQWANPPCGTGQYRVNSVWQVQVNGNWVGGGVVTQPHALA
jgi:hypothetical protein